MAAATTTTATFEDDFSTHFVVSFLDTMKQFAKETDKRLSSQLLSEYKKYSQEKVLDSLLQFSNKIQLHEDLIVERNETFFMDLNEKQENEELLPGVTMKSLNTLYEDSKAREGLWKYLQLFLLLSKQYKGINDDTTRSLIEQLRNQETKKSNTKSKASATAPSSPFDFANLQDDPFMKRLESSKIAKMARNFASQINADEFMKDLGMANLPGSGNAPPPLSSLLANLGKDPSVLSKMIHRIGESVKTQMADEEISGEQMKDEVETMIGSIKESPIINNVLKTIGGSDKGAMNLISGLVKSAAKDTMKADMLDEKTMTEIETDLENMWKGSGR